VARAWSMRDQPAYAHEDFQVMRQIVEAAKFTPGLWLLNRVANIWLDASSALRFAIRAPDDYVAAHTRFFDLIEAGDADTAVAHMGTYLERHDQKLVAVLEKMEQAA
jgi:DNA-binding FadR family transcriptional regulator